MKPDFNGEPSGMSPNPVFQTTVFGKNGEVTVTQSNFMPNAADDVSDAVYIRVDGWKQSE